MESRGNTPRIWIDNSDLGGILHGQGPFLTVYIATPGDIENAAQDNVAGWQAQRDRLVAEGATEDALLAIDDLVPTAHEHGAALYAIAGEKELHHVSYWAAPPVRTIAQWSALPVLAPVIDARQGALPYMTVVADRTGADMHVISYGNEVAADTVQGDPSDPIRKVNPGGWSQRRFQMRAEDTWQHNAQNTAARMAELVGAHNPRAVFLAGDVRAVQMIQSDLPKNLGASVIVVDGSRANDSGETISQSEIDHHLAKMEMEDTAALTEKLAEEMGQHDRAVTGTAGVTKYLQMTAVEVLFVHPAAAEGSTVWVGPSPEHIAKRADDLEALSVDTPMQVPLADGMIRAALLSGAGVRVVPRLDDTDEGVAALLRWV